MRLAAGQIRPVPGRIVPTIISELFASKDPAKSHRAMEAMLKMVKLDIKKLKKRLRGQRQNNSAKSQPINDHEHQDRLRSSESNHRPHYARQPTAIWPLCFIIDAPARKKLFRAWTEPELMKQWFTPRPWTTPVVETDVRPRRQQATSSCAARDGNEFSQSRRVFGSGKKNEAPCFLLMPTPKHGSHRPSPFMTGVLTF